MKKFTRNTIGALNFFKRTANHSEPLTRPEPEEGSIDAFYQRMFDRDIYLHVSEVSVAMIGVCLTGVSILNVDQDLNSADTYVDDLLAIDSFVFLSAYLLAYWVVRVMTKSNRSMHKVGSLANIIFLAGMIIMAIVCICIVLQGDYSLDRSPSN
jgi:hypothetical protein